MDDFFTYYRRQFGERWPALGAALHQPPVHTAFETGLRQPYYLDPASVAVAHLLPLDGARQVVDLCAAPGGKTLVLAARAAAEDAGETAGETAELFITANERSGPRRERLRRVLDTHLEPEVRRRITVTGHDASRWGLHHPGRYDAVLADVPCSSERHVAADQRELASWSPRRIKRLAVEQGAILAAAVDSTRPGGYILYVTCALTPEENDGVVGKILKKRRDRVEVCDPLERLERSGGADVPYAVREVLAAAETTEVGLHILPDTAAGVGPLYGALLRKTAE